MDCETNIDSIRALEEQIREHERTVIKLKRARNSLLNVSKLPPEVLGNVFRWNVTREGDFGGLDEGSHNFFAVCHHWFEVASRTPELWSSWGNTPEDWARYYHSRTTPLDLVLSGSYYGEYDDDEDGLEGYLRDALNRRATEDTIRRVHLKAEGAMLMDDIVAELTPKGGELRSNSMESLILWNLDSTLPVDVSDFFARCCFPKLQRLELTECMLSSWDHLPSRTSILTTLRLDFANPSPTPTTSQLLFMLSSNPALQRIALLGCAIPTDGGGQSSSRVQLRHLKELCLGGNFQHVLKLLDQVDHPRNLDSLTLTLGGCDVVDVSRTVGPYLRDHLQRRDRSQDGLNLLVSSAITHVTFRAGDARGIDFSAPSRAEINTFIRVDVALSGAHRGSVLERVALDLTTYVPQEEVVHFRIHKLGALVDAHTQFPNLRALSFDNIYLPTAFPKPKPHGEGRISPSLEHIFLENVVVDEGNWSPLVNFLAHRVSSGNRLDTLVIVRSTPIPPKATKSIRGMVRELRIEDEERGCHYQRW